MSSSIDQGKLYPPGYNNANPPGIPQFALTAGGGSSVASEIGQAGGSVTVDTLGGIFMTTSADSFIGLDTFNNISLNTSNTSATATIEMIGQSTITVQATDGLVVVESVANDSFLSLGLDVELQSRGALLGGGDVNVTNAGTIAFDTLGAGAITGVQFINGAVYPPSGSGATTSITQAGAIVACLGNGAIQISSIGVGADVEVYNAGTIRFDAMGAGAITGLSTINSVAYNPFPGSLSSISGGGATIQATSSVSLQASGSPFLTLNGIEALVPGKITLSAGASKPEVVLYDAAQNVAVNNLFSATPSYLTMDATGVVEVSGAAVNIANLSTVNGVPFLNGGTVSQNLTVSTLTAGVRLSTLALDVSSISGVAWPVPGYVLPSAVSVSSLSALDYVSTNAIYGVSSMSNATALDIYTNALTITGDVSFSLTDGNGGGISGTGNDVFITGVSSINGGTRPLTVSTQARVDIVATSDELHLEGSSLWLGAVSGSTDVNVYGNVLIPTAELQVSSIVGLSTLSSPDVLGITATDVAIAGGTNVSIVGGTNVSLVDVGGAGFSVIGGVVQINGGVGISSITGLSSINGVAYPETSLTVSSLTASDYVSTLSASGVSSITSGGSGYIDVIAGQIKLWDGIFPGLTVDNSNQVVSIPATNGLSVSSITGLSSINGTSYNNQSVSSISTLALNSVSSINGAVFPTPIRQGTFYKSAAQNLTSGNTDITFDLSGAWNNTGGYITHTDGSADFTVVQTGLYQLEFNAVVLVNNGTWTTTSNKTINIDITRPSIAEQALITSSGLQGLQSYGQCISGTIYLVAGDVINMRLGNIFTGGVPTPPQAQQLQNTFDLNTFFTWRYIS